MKQLKKLTFKCDNYKCMISDPEKENNKINFTFSTRDWCAQTGNDEGYNYIYVEENCPKCGKYCQKYYQLSDLLHMLMQEEVEE